MTLLNPGDRWGMPLSTPGSIPIADADGKLHWGENRPVPASWIQQWYTPGVSGSVYVQSLTGTGAAQSAIQTGEMRRPAGKLETGTTTSGRCSLYSGLQAVLVPTSGQTLIYECLVQVPVLSNGTDTFTAGFGLGDSAATNTFTRGVRFLYNTAVNATNWIAQVNNGTQTNYDTGIAVTAGTWYRMRIVVVGGASTTFYLVADDDYWTNGRSYGSAIATDSSDLSGVVGLFPVAGLTKSIGTTSTAVYVSFINCVRIPSRTTPVRAVGGLGSDEGMGLPQALPGQTLLVDSSGRPYWGDYLTDTDQTPFYAHDHGGFEGTFTSNFSGAGATIVRTPVQGQPPCMFLFTGSTATGYARRELKAAGEPFTLTIQDPSTLGVNCRLVYETVFTTSTTLSGGTDTYVCQAGFLPDTVDAGAVRAGAWLEWDANVDSHFQFKVRSHNAETWVDQTQTTTLAVVASETYWFRIFWTPFGDIVFQLVPEGSPLSSGVTWTTSQQAALGGIAGGNCGCGIAITKLTGTSTGPGRLYTPYQLAYTRYL